VKIVDAIELAAAALDGDPFPAADWSGKVGSPMPRYQAEELTLGDRGYIDDMTLSGMLHGAVLLSPHPRARVEAIDVRPALALAPGAPKIHPKGNLLSSSGVKRGDVTAALQQSAHVVTGTWRTQFIEHAFLEPESCVALVDPPSADGAPPALHVYTQGQGVYD